MTMTITSTTDSVAEVEHALGIEPKTAPAAGADGTSGATSESGDGSGPSDDNEQENANGSEAASSAGSEDSNDDIEGETEEETEGEETGVAARDKGAPATEGKTGKSSGLNKRFGKLTGKIGTLETALNYQLTQNQQLQDRLAAIERDKPKEKPEEKKAAEEKADEIPPLRKQPSTKDKNADGTLKYETYGDYLDDLSAFGLEASQHAETKAEKRAAKLIADAVTALKAEMTTQQTQQSEASKAQAITDAFIARQQEAMTAYKDYEATVNNPAVKISQTMYKLMASHPQGAHLAYWYGKNPAEVARIFPLSAEEQLLELGPVLKSLGSKKAPSVTGAAGELNADGTPKAKRSAAPRPARPLGSNGRASTTTVNRRAAEQMSLADYRQARLEGRIK